MILNQEKKSELYRSIHGSVTVKLMIRPISDISDINWIHVEASTRCNAWCPACPRNIEGHTLRPGLVPGDIDLDILSNTIDELPNLKTVQLCGNEGDPIAHRSAYRLISLIVKKNLKVQIHTNGGLRSKSWWRDLGKQLRNFDHCVWFGIDGIDATHEIYRQGTKFEKVIENAKSFIDAGGRAIWQFIPFAHNEHEINQCLELSQVLGFQDFKIIKSFRDKNHKIRNYKDGKIIGNLEPSTVYKKLFFRPKKESVEPSSCMHLSIPSIYMSVDGRFSPCCYFSDKRNFESIIELLKNVNIMTELNSPDVTCIDNCSFL